VPIIPVFGFAGCAATGTGIATGVDPPAGQAAGVAATGCIGGGSGTGVDVGVETGTAVRFVETSAPHWAQNFSLPVSGLPQLLQNAMADSSPQR